MVELTPVVWQLATEVGINAEVCTDAGVAVTGVDAFGAKHDAVVVFHSSNNLGTCLAKFIKIEQ